MATRMASHDCEGQSEPINGTMLRDKKKKKQQQQDKDQITNYASCHFYSCFAKKKCLCVFYVCLFPRLPLSYCLCKPVMTVGCQCIGCTGGKNMNAFFFFRTLTDF